MSFRKFIVLSLFLFTSINSWASLPDEVFSIFSSRCAECHGPNSPAEGGFGDILDFQALRKSGVYVIPGNPEESEIFQQISLDFMPDVGEPLSTNEKAKIKKWILEGAQDPTQVDFQKVSRRQLENGILDFLAKIKSSDRKFFRFVSFIHLDNLNPSPENRQLHFQALSKLVNSLSQNPKIVQPTFVPNLNDSVFAIDLRDYQWSIELWEEASLKFPFHIHTPRTAQIIIQLDSSTPIVHGDWLLENFSREPFYGRFLGHPENARDLEASMGVDIPKNTEKFSIARSGFLESGVSNNNRIIERHKIPGRDGAYWISYDFANSSGEKNIFKNPFSPFGPHSTERVFAPDGGEIIYSLPNGMQAYLLTNAKGTVISEAPLEIVQDTDLRRPVIFNGISCFSCHSDGMRKGFDNVLKGALATDYFNSSEKSLLQKIYTPREQLEPLFDSDSSVYQRALKKAGVDVVGQNDDQINKIVFSYLNQSVGLPLAAEILSVSEDQLTRAIEDSNDFILNRFLTKLKADSGVARETFVGFFPRLSRLFNTPARVLDMALEISAVEPDENIVLAEGVYSMKNIILLKSISIEGVDQKRVIISEDFQIRVGNNFGGAGSSKLKFSNFTMTPNTKQTFFIFENSEVLINNAKISSPDGTKRGLATFSRGFLKITNSTLENLVLSTTQAGRIELIGNKLIEVDTLGNISIVP